LLLSIAVDETRCNGCRRCEAVCQVVSLANGGLALPRIRIHRGEGGWRVRICRHCEQAPCADACVSGAMRADPARGVVELDASRCVGCYSCVMECPFGAVFMVEIEAGGCRAVKCDGCRERGDLWCARYCPTGALRAGETSGAVATQIRRERAWRLHGAQPYGGGARWR